MTESFTAPWSRLLKWVSLGVSGILIGVVFLVARDLATSSWIRALAVLGTLAAVLLSALFTIRGYELDGAVLRIRRLLWSTLLELDGLRSVEADPEAMKRSLRLFGNGGLFSFTGLFRSKKLGNYRAYVTDPGRAVVLKFGNRTVVVSPGDPTLFARRIQELRRLS